MAVIGAWLLLPPYMIDIAGLPDYSKTAAASLGMLFGTLFLDSIRSWHSVHAGSTYQCYCGASPAFPLT